MCTSNSAFKSDVTWLAWSGAASGLSSPEMPFRHPCIDGLQQQIHLVPFALASAVVLTCCTIMANSTVLTSLPILMLGIQQDVSVQLSTGAHLASEPRPACCDGCSPRDQGTRQGTEQNLLRTSPSKEAERPRWASSSDTSLLPRTSICA